MYFPNGTSFLDWQEHNCTRCLHYTDNGTGSKGCPLTDVHFLYADERHKSEPVKEILDTLIGNDGKCSMQAPRDMLVRVRDAKKCRRTGCNEAGDPSRDGWCEDCS